MSRKPIYTAVITFAPSVNMSRVDTTKDRTPFTYYIAWVNEYGSVTACYYGVKYAKGCHPSDLWKSYFTSSKYVKDYRASHGEPQIVEVRSVFQDVTSARTHEYTVLRRLNVTQSTLWLNDDCGNRSGGMTELGKRRMRETCLERYGADHPLKTAEGIEKFKAGCNRTLGVDFPMQSPEVKAKRVESYLSTLGVDHPMRSQDVKDGMKLRSVDKYGVDHPSKSESVKKKMSDSAKNRKKLTCPHCSKVIPCNVAYRFHFDNCKFFQPLCQPSFS